jgi:hypothetical protein
MRRPLAADRVLACLLLVVAVVHTRNTAWNGQDFEVMWRAAGHLLAGERIYDLGRDGGMVYKYPPWILPFFTPFRLLSLEAARWAFGAVQAVSILSIVAWVRLRLGLGPWKCAALFLGFWGLWMVHTLDGQVAAPMLSLMLWAWRPGILASAGIRSAGVSLVSTTKIFTVFPLLGEWPGWGRALRLAAVAGVAAAVLSIPAWRSEGGGGPERLLRAWASAASSGASHLDPGQTRGRGNPALSAWVLGKLGVPAARVEIEVAFVLGVGGLIALFLRQMAPGFAPAERWALWLGVVPLVHPLPWWHLYVFAFPLAAVVMRHVAARPSPGLISALLTALFLVCAATTKVLGDWGWIFELNAGKSWGVLLLLSMVFVLRRRVA